jgi:hypothetical protein
MRVGLNIDANITKYLKFYSTIAMAKFWNLSDRNVRNAEETGNFQSFAGSHGYKGSEAHFDMAYISYKFKESNWTMAVGRMPTNNGPPLNKVDGLGRTGTYPSLSYNNIMDGLASVYNFKSWVPKDHSLKLRLFYTPFIRIDKNDRGQQVVDSYTNEKVESHGAFYTLLSEYSIKNLDWAKKLDLFYSAYHVDKFYSETKQKLEGTPPTPLAADFYHDGIDYFKAVSNTVYAGIDQLLDSGLSLSFSYSHYTVDYAGDQYESDNYMITSDYRFDNSLNSGDILGIEYLKTDKNRVPTEETTLYSNNFYNMINGEGTHLYYTNVINANQLIRIGYFAYKTQDSKLLLIDLETKNEASYIRWKVFF